ncbi:thiamine biosynthesis lipoprotein ApbE [Deferribacter desulfuricans SSM1]|uniref:FAD:protein FMN transferase n=1 Tax=Deferribacter desulfuricans (strain DSM 14783 / JCM 11476 / NBRC 101012 / SSM1) TaxID=639282 RepID=D3PC03_DEFDS|nr:thiamine biosynthesis lipoprotein ApbE [Deferribacter desulfuricans SSM1]
MSKLPKSIIFCFITFILISCSNDNKYISKSFYALGTIVNITVPAKNENLIEKTYKLIQNKESEIKSFYENINSAKPFQKIKINSEIKSLLKDSIYFSNISNGKFDITIYTITSLYGFPEGPFKQPAYEKIRDALTKIGISHIHMENETIFKDNDILIDMGAYAKGYIVDKAVELLKNNGVKNAIVDAGGDLFALGDKNGKKWKIAIKHPDKPDSFLSIVSIANKAVVTSGNYERFFITKDGKRIIHIFDATTGKTANNYKSISVIADNTEIADALSTVYFLLPIEKIKKLCEKLNTPVLVYTLDNKLIKLCSWESYEN